jgi:hypothetical protein
MNNSGVLRAVRCGIAGAMLAAGAVAFEAPAVPFFTTDTRELIGASSSEGWLPDELSRFALPMATDRFFGDLHDVLGRWAGFDELPNGLDAAADTRGHYDQLFGHGERSLELPLNARSRPGAGPESGNAGVIDGILRSARDSLLDENDTASISLAGIEVSATLKGDRRSLTINGYDLLPVLLQVSRGDESSRESPTNAVPEQVIRSSAMSTEPTEAAGAPPAYLRVTDMVTEAREVIFHPLSLLIGFACGLIWLVVRLSLLVRAR